MTNKEIASILQETADLIELTDGNPHRARAFARAARSLTDLDDRVEDRLNAGTLTDIDGIGDAMADHVADVAASGTFPLHDELQNSIPPGLQEVLRVNGLGTKRTRRLWKELDVTSLDDLEQAAESGQISTLSGFGAKTQQNILENVRRLRTYDTQWRFAEAWTAVTPFLKELRAQTAVERAALTGELRRRQETVEHAEVIVATESPPTIRSWIENHLDTSVSPEETVLETRLPEGIPLRVHVTVPARFGTAHWKTTGSRAHCEAFLADHGDPGNYPTEEALFDEAGLPPIPPEIREDRGELDAAARDALPSLLRREDLEGCLHNHSTYSDGSASLREMATTARSLGFSYFGICDHSQSLNIAGGLSPDEVRAQQEEVSSLNETLAENGSSDFHIFHGIESDILRDGSLDYEDDVLSLLDFVVASVHTGFSMSEGEATERIIEAVRNPHTRILGHPTGRLLLVREGYPINHERVIEACAENDVAIELNANPYRLDLDWRWIRQAVEQNVLISINPDAHSPDELKNVRWGISVGRKGWLTPDACLNAKSLSDFTDWLSGSQ